MNTKRKFTDTRRQLIFAMATTPAAISLASSHSNEDNSTSNDNSDSQSSRRNFRDGLALALSGGGYRAMIYHAGVVWRLYEFGLLRDCKRISSVSGGSITSAWLGLQWEKLYSSNSIDIDLFSELIINPLLDVGSKTIDVKAGLKGLLLPGNISSKVEKSYNKHLFNHASLQDLPDDSISGNPTFIILSTNLKTGALARFARQYFREYKTGQVVNPNVSVAKAVAASSAFPPVLSPTNLNFKDGEVVNFDDHSAEFFDNKKFRNNYRLGDGGIYDNIGFEPIDRFEDFIVSNAGASNVPVEKVSSNWLSQTLRVLNTIDNQVRSLRKQELFDLRRQPGRDGAYWQIDLPIVDKEYSAPGLLDFPVELTKVLASTPTRLKKLNLDYQKLLINWGYASCDASIRTFYKKAKNKPAPENFPFPEIMTHWEDVVSEERGNDWKSKI